MNTITIHNSYTHIHTLSSIYRDIYPDDFTHVVISSFHDFHGDHFGSLPIDVFVRLNLTSCRSMDPLGSLGHVCTEATSLGRNEFYVFLSQDGHQKFAPENFPQIFQAKKWLLQFHAINCVKTNGRLPACLTFLPGHSLQLLPWCLG